MAENIKGVDLHLSHLLGSLVFAHEKIKSFSLAYDPGPLMKGVVNQVVTGLIPGAAILIEI